MPRSHTVLRLAQLAALLTACAEPSGAEGESRIVDGPPPAESVTTPPDDRHGASTPPGNFITACGDVGWPEARQERWLEDLDEEWARAATLLLDSRKGRRWQGIERLLDIHHEVHAWGDRISAPHLETWLSMIRGEVDTTVAIHGELITSRLQRRGEEILRSMDAALGGCNTDDARKILHDELKPLAERMIIIDEGHLDRVDSLLGHGEGLLRGDPLDLRSLDPDAAFPGDAAARD